MLWKLLLGVRKLKYLRKQIGLVLFLAAGMLGTRVWAIDDLAADTAQINDTASVVDTAIFVPGNTLEIYVPVIDTTNFERKLSQNPTKALFKSMLVPGWGQLANGSPVRAVIYAGLDAWFISAALHYKTQASDFRDLYSQTTNVELRNDYYDLFNDRRDERNKFTWFAVIVTFVAMFDAYVDAHLSGFPSQKNHPVDLSLEAGDKGKLAAEIQFGF